MKVKILLVLFVLNSSYNFAQIDNYDSLNFTFDKLSLSEEYDSALEVDTLAKVQKKEGQYENIIAPHKTCFSRSKTYIS